VPESILKAEELRSRWFCFRALCFKGTVLR